MCLHWKLYDIAAIFRYQTCGCCANKRASHRKKSTEFALGIGRILGGQFTVFQAGVMTIQKKMIRKMIHLPCSIVWDVRFALSVNVKGYTKSGMQWNTEQPLYGSDESSSHIEQSREIHARIAIAHINCANIPQSTKTAAAAATRDWKQMSE